MITGSWYVMGIKMLKVSYIQTKSMPEHLLIVLLLNLVMVSCVATFNRDDNREHQQSNDIFSSLSEANLRFTLKLHKELSKDDTKNIFFSPFSISIALAMTLLGAKERTVVQLADVLGVSDVQFDIHKSFEKYLSILLKENLNFTLHTANRLFPNHKSKIEDDYVEKCMKHYNTDVVPLDFSQNEAARKTINDWVSKMTKDKIKDLIGAGVLNADVVMVLVNAVYFKGNWASQFNTKTTHKGQFHINLSEKVEVDMMYKKMKFNFGYSQKLFCSVLEMPYKGDSLSMVFILPDTIDGLSAIEDEITPDIFNELQGTMRNDEKVEVYLPKFKLETKFELSSVLAKLGMPDAFDSRKADFSGIDKTKSVVISEVIHQAFVEVNEEGTEATAATGVISLGISDVREPVFKADRPFLFFIKDKRTNMILFSGRCSRPEGNLVKEEL